MSDVMARPQKHGEPTVKVSIRMPLSLVERLAYELKGSTSENVIEACKEWAHWDPTPLPDITLIRENGEVLKAKPGQFIPLEADEKPPTICHHPKARLRNVAKGKRCLDCGETFK